MNSQKQYPIVLIGGGGHAAVLADILFSQQRKILAVVSVSENIARNVLGEIERLVNDDQVRKFDPNKVRLVNGIGSVPGNNLRQEIYQKFTGMGYKFENVISERAFVSSYVKLAEGVQIMQGAIIQVGAAIGANSIVNTSATIDHDCIIGNHNHIAPSATLSGGVVTHESVHIGTGANIIQLITIGKCAVVGAGATVTKDVSSGKTVYPAKNYIR